MASLGDVARAVEAGEDADVSGYDADSTAGDAHESRKVGGSTLTKTREELEKSWRQFTSMLRAPLAASRDPRGLTENATTKIGSLYRRGLEHAPAWLMKRVTFYRIHFTCFVVVMLIGSLVMWLSPNGAGGPISFVDSMYVSSPWATTCLLALASWQGHGITKIATM